MSPRFEKSRTAATRLRELVPGGAHTYAKGPDQYPSDCAPVIARGRGSRVWDVDGHEYVEFGSGLRSVILGHAHPAITEAVCREVALGTNFVRPSALELRAAEAFLEAVPTMEMVKFAKNGSDATTAGVRLARAFTGRDIVAFCRDHPFFSTDDWFIGSTPMDAGIPEAIKELTTHFPYGDLEALHHLFRSHPGRIACLVLEPVSGAFEPPEGYLSDVIRLAHEHGAVVIVDEMITGFRFALEGAHASVGAIPDLCTFGKGIGNGLSVSALAGRRELMELGGLASSRDRVFLLSTTHGAESVGLAALLATIEVHRRDGVSEQLTDRGRALREALTPVIADAGLQEHLILNGRDCNMVFGTLDPDYRPSQQFRTLFMRHLILHGVVGPSFVVNTALTQQDIEVTTRAVAAAGHAYARALDRGFPTAEEMGGASVKPVFRRRS